MPPRRHAVVSGLAGPNGTPPARPDPVIPNGAPDPELVTIGTDFERPAGGLVRPCCLRCAKAMVNDPALVCHRPTRWVNCLRCYRQHDKCHNVPSVFFPTLRRLQEEADALPEDEKHRGPTGSRARKVHRANVAHLTKAMEAYYGSRGRTYTEKTLQRLHLRLKQQKVEALRHLVDSQ
ncbi:MAG: hypothetical protein M1815_000174 [Lichina confinis]|nr:MAG: hypothetical protein M1815_000174 [Lichina confinis]